MDALHEARTRIEQAYYDERGMAEVMRQDAAVYAAIAQAEESKRIADALEKIADALEAMSRDGLKTWTRNPEAI